MNSFGKLATAGVVVFVLLQVMRPTIPAKSKTAELAAPANVKRILEKSCFTCHSEQPKLAWFDQVVPAYWLVRHDILTAREHLNMSMLGTKPAAVQRAALYEAVNMIQMGAMPLSNFLRLHPEARVTREELETLKAYLAPWTPAHDNPGSASVTTRNNDAAPASVSENASQPAYRARVEPESNGLPYDPNFESWRPISTTDRGDNNTFRFILGNDIAFEAARSGKISPWPDGSRLAKVAWQQQRGSDGRMYPGKFVQVELMVKDAGQYRRSDGWGWGRWRGLDLKPYGSNAQFVNECTGCHLPVRGNDYVYTLPITRAHIDGREIANNTAALPLSLPFQPLEWAAITLYVDGATHTTATLYGNELAVKAARAHRTALSKETKPAYPAGAVLSLVTWSQREDPHWFGARIPDKPISVEYVQIAEAGQSNAYRRFAGEKMVEDRSVADAAERIRFILGLAPVQLPF